MSYKETLHLVDYYPNTYMEKFCQALHPELEMENGCVVWFRQAIEHCTDLLSDARKPTNYFWSTLKNFIFPERITDITSQKIPINIHPQRLSMRECQSLFFNIVSDYLQRAPRYAAESFVNSLLWQLFYSLLGFMVLSSFFLVVVYVFYKYGQPKHMINFIEEFYKPQKRMQAIATKSLRVAKTELRNLKIKRMPREDDIVAPDGNNILVLKVATKYEFLESMVQGCLYSVGKFHRLYDQHNKTKTDFKYESLTKALKFLNQNCQKLHLMVMFEDDKEYEYDEEEEEEAASKHLKNSPRIKRLSPPLKTSPRFMTSTSKQKFDTRLEEGNMRQKPARETNTTGDRNSRSSTPKLQNTPRSNNTPRCSSGIPRTRNVQQASLSARKSK